MSKRQQRSRQDEKRGDERGNRAGKLALGAGLTVGATLVAGGTAEADIIPVTTLSDTGTGSLRDAITTADASTGVVDKILFDSSLSGTINLATDLPPITDDTYIYDPYGTNKITVNGHGNGIFNIDMAATANSYSVYLGDMTLTDGSNIDGGAVYNENAYVVEGYMNLTGNNATYGGAQSDAPGSRSFVFASTMSGNHATGSGGAWDAYGSSSRAFASTLSGNTADGDGGAVFATSGTYTNYYEGGHVALVNSTISGNSAGGGGGGVADEQRQSYYHCAAYYNTAPYYCYLGEVYRVYAGTTYLNSDTVSGNSAADGGGVYENLRSRVDAQPYGYYPGESPYDPFLGNVIVANSTGAPDLDGTFFGSFDLIENIGSASLTDENPTSIITGVDPQLGALANNGGPTPTQALSVTSPALDQGGYDYISSGDQRYMTRPVDLPSIPNSSAPGSDGADIGAFEMQTAEFAAGTAGGGGGGGGATPPSNQFSFGGVKLNKKKGTAKLTVNVPGAGTLTAAGGGVVKQRHGRISAVVNKVVSAAGKVKLLIKAKGKKKKQLNATGKVTVKPTITFTPNGGTAKSQKKKIKLKKT